ncbi:5'-deoxynucleotidase HDDC2 [Culicoides brevitarsis]|uniref:5'-deoxynucleotidase HDDC2 n=1 Tax=Culicoides brevitarsis TaxID=469753 RepID=UPI00307BCFC6
MNLVARSSRTVFSVIESRAFFRSLVKNQYFGRKMSSASSTDNKYKDYVKFLELVGGLKHIKRTGWVLRDVKDCESISGHMYRMSVMTFLLEKNPENENLDRVKCMEMALVHDLAEAVVGDITPYCGISREEKQQRELEAMKDIAKLTNSGSDKLMELFHEYEKGETPEAKFVKDLDRLDLIMQAFEYEKRDENPERLQEFFDSTEGKFQHPFVKKIVSEIYAQRLEHQAKLKNQSQQSS